MTDPRCFYCGRPMGVCDCYNLMVDMVENYNDEEFNKLVKDIINQYTKGVCDDDCKEH